MTENDYVITDLENVDPSPIAPRICACGCGVTFQPRRSNQFNINKRHTDKGYHDKVRKPRQKNQNAIEKHLSANDRICAKYFNSQDRIEAVCTFESLRADGFNTSYSLGHVIIDKITYFVTYNYLIHFFKEDTTEKVKIRKR